MTQATLPFEATIQERFEQFHAAHPEVYAYLVALCQELRRRGFQRYGIKSLWERARWHFQVERELGEEWKLNNNYHSRYARKIMAEHPELSGFFEVREIKAA